MKKILRSTLHFLGAFFFALPFNACDDIADSERVIMGETNAYSKIFETSFVVVDNEMFTVNREHNLLITDFTGWKCVNCPTVAEGLITKIIPNYASVLVSLHMTTNSFSMSHPNKYNCASADSIANWIYGSNIATQLSLPSVSIDNVLFQGEVFNSDINYLEQLAASRYKACDIEKTEPVANISVNVSDNGDDTYDISTLVMYPNANNCNIKLWLIEEGLISSMQSSMTGYIRNYENHGILRQVINGSYEGQNITLNDKGQAVVRTKLNISGKGYKPENCRVVAFITNVSDRTVINCTEAHLVVE